MPGESSAETAERVTDSEPAPPLPAPPPQGSGLTPPVLVLHLRKALPRVQSALAAVRRALTLPRGSAARDPVVVAVALAAFGAYLVISLARLVTLTPGTYDLAMYTEYVRQLSQLHAPVDDILAPGFDLLGDHFQVAVGAIAPLFRLFPSPATLLAVQALCVALSVFPVATAARELAGRANGRLIAFSYAFSWGLQELTAYEFHEVALAVPLVACSVSALVRRRPRAAAAWALPLVLMKEDQGFTVAAVGLLLAATALYPRLLRPATAPADQPGYRRAALRGGALLFVWGLGWSVLEVTVLIPHFNPDHVYRYWDLAGGVVGGSQPFSAAALLVQAGGGWPTKGVTVALLLLPTAFAALGSPVALLAVPALALRFISRDPAYWGIYWHYNATVMPVLFLSAAEALSRWRCVPALAWRVPAAPGSAPGPAAAPGTGSLTAWLRWRAGRLRDGWCDLLHLVQASLVRNGGAMMAALTVALMFQFPLSQLWHGATYKPGPRVAAARTAIGLIPDGATVTATTDLLAPLAARADTFWIGNPGDPHAQYVVFDGADSGFDPAITDVPAFIAGRYPSDGYAEEFSRADVYVFRRR